MWVCNWGVEGPGEAIRRTLGTLTPGKNISGAEQHEVVEIRVSLANLLVFSYYFSYTKKYAKITVWPDVSFALQPMKFEKCQLCHYLCLKPQTGTLLVKIRMNSYRCLLSDERD